MVGIKEKRKTGSKERKRPTRVKERTLTQRDRDIFSKNAIKGTELWKKESHEERVKQRESNPKAWGFEGKSPRTVERKNLSKEDARRLRTAVHKVSENHQSEERKKNTSEPTQRQYEVTLEDLGLINDKGKIPLNKRLVASYFTQKEEGRSSIKVEDGNLTFQTIEGSHVSMVTEHISDCKLPDGYYKIIMKDDKPTMERIYPSEADINLKAPPLTYENGWQFRLEGEALRKVIAATRVKKSGDAFRFNLTERNGLKYTVISGKHWDDAEGKDVNHEIEAIPTEAPASSVGEGVSYPSEYIGNVLSVMLGGVRGKKNDHSVVMNMKMDYPVKMTTRRIGPENTHVEIEGIIAPRVD